jgi:hypothetical protein
MLIRIIIFVVLCIAQSSVAKSEVYEGWLDADSTGPVIPIWMELHEEPGNRYTGWYVNRMEHDTIFFSGEKSNNGILLKVTTTRLIVNEQFTLTETDFGFEGFWKPKKGYGADVKLFLTSEDYSKTINLTIDTNILKKGKGKNDSITDIQFLMVRKGIASMKVYREREDGNRPWITFHVIDIMKNKEIQLTDYLIDYAFATKKILADAQAEEIAIHHIQQYGEDELSTMKDCGMDLEQELHLDNVVLYPNRTAITFDYLNIFGLHEECEYLMYPVQYTLPIEEFKQCIRPGSFLARLLL